MAAKMTIDPAEVQAIAGNIQSLNEELTDLLNGTKARIHSLGSTFTGAASEATVSAFDRFANSYFSTYHDMIERYVQFLRASVVEGYTQVETLNKSLADKLW